MNLLALIFLLLGQAQSAMFHAANYATTPVVTASWALNEGSGSTATDATGNGWTGTWHGTQSCSGTYYTAGYNQTYAGCFDGSTNYVSTSLTYPTAGAPFTVSVWVYPTAALPAGSVLLVGETGNLSSGWSLMGYSSGIALYASHSPYCVSGTAPTTNAWNLIRANFDGTNCHIYLNGVLKASTAVSPPTSSSTTVNIGHASGSSVFFQGYMQDLQIYSGT